MLVEPGPVPWREPRGQGAADCRRARPRGGRTGGAPSVA